MKALKNGKKITYCGNGRGHVDSLKFTWKVLTFFCRETRGF